MSIGTLTVPRSVLRQQQGGIRIVEDGKGDDRAAALLEAFPDVDPGLVPYGSRVLCQLRTAQAMTKGGIIVPPDSKQTQQDNMQVAKVIALGPLAFRNRSTREPWPEGAWAQVGEFVRVAKYGGDRWVLPVPGTQDTVEFVVFNDLDLIGRYTGDPLVVKAFI